MMAMSFSNCNALSITVRVPSRLGCETQWWDKSEWDNRSELLRSESSAAQLCSFEEATQLRYKGYLGCGEDSDSEE